MTTIRLGRLSFAAAILFGNGSTGFPERKSGFSTSNGVRRRGNSKERSWSTPPRCPGAEWAFPSRSSLPGRGVRIVESLQGRARYFCSITPLERSTVFVFTWPRSLRSTPYSEPSRNGHPWVTSPPGLLFSRPPGGEDRNVWPFHRPPRRFNHLESGRAARLLDLRCARRACVCHR